MPSASIHIRGAWAELKGAPVKVLEALLALPDPNREYNRAFKEKRWDGLVRLYEGLRFPAGFQEKIAQALAEEGYDVDVTNLEQVKRLPVEEMDDQYLPGITLWNHQMGAILALLGALRGFIKVPTGGGKTEIFAAVALFLWSELGWRSFLVTSKRGILDQTRRRLEKYYGPDVRVGQYGDGQKTKGDIMVATAQSMMGYKPRTKNTRNGIQRIAADPFLQEIINEFECMFLDEAHHTQAETWYEIAMKCKAIRRYGMSGTPLKDVDLADARLMCATGPLLYSIEPTELQEQGISAKAKIAMVMADNASAPPLPKVWRVFRDRETGEEIPREVNMPYKEAYVKGVIQSVEHNTTVTRAATWLVDHGRKVLVVCRRKDHWQLLREHFAGQGIEFAALWGDSTTLLRNRAKDEMNDGKISLILATTIFDEGEDVPAIDAIVLAEGVKVSTNAIQRIGRGTRKKGEDGGDCWVVDIVPVCHKRLAEHALERCKAYEGEGYEVRIVEDWPAHDDTDFDDEHLLPFKQWESDEA